MTRRFRWYCHRCGIRTPGAGLPTPAEACRLGLLHYDLVHRDADTAAMRAAA